MNSALFLQQKDHFKDAATSQNLLLFHFLRCLVLGISFTFVFLTHFYRMEVKWSFMVCKFNAYCIY